MKKRGERLVVLLLSVMMVLSQMSVAAFAVAEGEAPEGSPAVTEQPAADETAVTDGADNQTHADLKAEEATVSGKVTVINNSNKKIKVVGTNKGMNRTEYVEANGGSKEMTLETISRIDAKTPVTLSGIYPAYDVATYDSEYAYSLDFGTVEVSDNYSMTVMNDADVAMVKFAGNGGEGDMLPQVFRKGHAGALDANEFTKEGCAFLGWSGTADGAVEYSDAQSVTIDADVTLYAVWHTHAWEVIATGEPPYDTVTIGCEESGCPYEDVEVSISAEDKTYDASEYDLVEVSKSKKTLPEGFEVGEISFFDEDGNAFSGAPVDAGTYTAEVSILRDGEAVDSISTDFTIAKRPLAVKAEDKVKAYGAPDPELTCTVSGLADGDSKETVLSGALKRDGDENVGEYYIRQGTLAANDNYELSFTNGVFTIGQNISRVTKAPEIIEGLVYNGQAQALIEPGEASGGELLYFRGEEYSDDPDDWQSTVPKGRKAGDFTVWYKVEGDSNHTSVPPQKLGVVSIAPLEVEAVWGTDMLCYNGAEQAPEVSAVDPISGDAMDLVVEGAETDANITTGVEYVAVACIEDPNYELINNECEFTIYPKTVRIVWTDEEYTYDGEAHRPTARVVKKDLVSGDICGVGEYQIVKPAGEGGPEPVDEAVDAGTYVVYAYADNPNYSFLNVYEFVTQDEETNPVEQNDQEKEFTISKANFSTAVTIEGWTYGDEANEPEVTNNPGDGEVSFEYRAVDAPADSYTDEVPSEAGSYRVHASIAETDNYNKADAWADFTIAPTDSDISVSIEDWTYGDPANEPVVEGNISGGEVTYWYAGTTNSGTEYSSAEAPFEAGSYTVGVRVHKTPNMTEDKTANAPFTIDRAGADFDVSIEGWTYNEYDYEENKVVVDANEEISDEGFSYYYSETASGERYLLTNEEELGDLDAGSYYLWVESSVTANYYAGVESARFRVSKADLDIEVRGREGLVYWYQDEDGEGVLQKLVEVIGFVPEGVSISYKTRLLGQYSEEIPEGANAGSYNIWYRIDGGKNYNDVAPLIHISPDFTVEIAKAVIDGAEVEIEGWTYGQYDEDENAPRVNLMTIPDDYVEYDNISFEYAEYVDPDTVDDDYDFGYSEEVPEDAGTYCVRAVFGETGNYAESVSEPTMFRIDKADIDLSVSIEDWTYGEEAAEPSVEGNTGDGELAFWYYGITNGGDDYSAAAAPTQAGSYHLIAAAAETDNYNAGTATANFEIERADIDPPAELDINGWAFDDYVATIDGPFVNGLPDDFEYGDAVSYEYATLTTNQRPSSVEDDEFTPITIDELNGLEVGRYAIRAQIAETDNYNASQTEAVAFRITTGDAKYDKSMLPTAAENLVYDGDPYDLIEMPEGGDDYWLNGDNTLYWAVTTLPVRPLPIFFTKVSEGYEIPSRTNADLYYVWFRVRSDDRETANEGPLRVRIEKAEIEPTVSIEGWTYGDAAKRPVVEGNTGNGDVSYRYTGTTAAGNSYSSRIAPNAAGEFTVTAYIEETANYKAGEASCDFTVEKGDPSVIYGNRFPEAIEDLVYDGSYQKVLTAGTVGDRRIKGHFEYSRNPDSNFTTFVPTEMNAGDYVVYYKIVCSDDSNFATTEPVAVNVSIAKAYPEFDAPAAKDLTYNGRNQALITEGSTSAADMSFSYKPAGGSFGSDVPEAKDAGNYVIEYKLTGNPNYNDAEGSVNARIGAKRVSISKDKNQFTYNGSEQRPVITISGVVAGDDCSPVVEYSGDADSIDAGQYIGGVRLDGADCGNYTLTLVDIFFTYEILPKEVSIEWEGVNSFTYDGSEKSVMPNLIGVTELEARDMNRVTVALSGEKATEVGSYTAKASLAGDGSDNYFISDGSDSYSWEITQPAPAPVDPYAETEAAITSRTSDSDMAGATYSTLRLRSNKQTKSSINLSWTEATGAVKYVVYGNRCGVNNKLQRLVSVQSNSYNVKGLKKGTYHKYMVVALDANNNVVSMSKLIHVATKGGKYGNHKSVKISGAVIKKAKSLKPGKSLKLKAKATGGKVKKHVGIRYESNNPGVASVSGNGKVKAVAKGSCYVYAYAQNGAFKKVKVTVK